MKTAPPRSENDSSQQDTEDIAHEELIRPRKYMIRSSSKRLFYWDIVIILLAIYNSFSLPLVIAFTPEVSLFTNPLDK